ncbi:hypothetical protein [Feifania hominis]|uniref:Uncharacterized protein n=1 Tax=Feifania hominis TaxID=2763660 RepID=A0A926HUH0_9FIRM|nr:hypothetical protein [Feifania hominis]MBC8536283.1 hypothetical protein [Feifania hominis]
MGKSKLYERRFVAFLDILGFRGLVNDPSRHVFFAGFFAAINKFCDMDLRGIHLTDLAVTSISDSIVISVPRRRSSCFHKLTSVVKVLTSMALKEGILLRGAIAEGELYHRDNIVFGPALVEAYELQENCAIYPRCIVRPEVLASGLATYRGKWVQFEYEDFRKDADGFYYVDYLPGTFKMCGARGDILRSHDSGDGLCGIEDVRELIAGANPSGDRVRAKYEWLRSYYNDTVSELGEKQKCDFSKLLLTDEECGDPAVRFGQSDV